MWPNVKATDSHSGYGLDLAMARGERPRKIQQHWVQAVVAENIQEAMANDPLKRSATELGAAAGVGRKSVERLRDGKNSTLTTLGAVADALGLDPARLLVRRRTGSSVEPAKGVTSMPGYPKMLDTAVKKSERKVRDRKNRTR